MSPERPATSRIKVVLLVEDEAGIRASVKRFLEIHGFVVLEADSIAEAEKAFQATRLDAAIFDYGLPDGDGLALVNSLRRFDATVPIVLLTAQGSIDLAARALTEGVDRFLTKPIELPALLAIVERLIETHRQDRAEAGRAQRDPS